ncbi:MAG TPA: serine hydrolase [Anaerolineales bacterium]|nr:serine hydrolase [Anaerolineales bacterium]
MNSKQEKDLIRSETNRSRHTALWPSIILLVLVVLLTGCAQLESPAWPDAPAPAYWPTDAWQASTPEQQGLDSEKLVEMLEAVQEEQIDLHSLLIVRNGELVLEAYYDPYGPDDLHTLESNTKSVIAALVGIAIDQGKIKDVNQKLLDFFPDRSVVNIDRRKEAITLQDLLSMTSGLDCQDSTPAAVEMFGVDDWVQYLLNLPVKTEPGTEWAYCSGSSHLVSAILEETTGLDARSFANKFLFRPMGITGVKLEDWGGDPEGITNGIAGLYLTPRDLAKLGLLYLQKGKWEDEQLVPEAWIEEATSDHAYTKPDAFVGGLNRRFGYMFSVFPDQKMYGYLGRAGQELYIVPEQNLVVVFTAALEVGKEARLLGLMNDYIVPAVQSQGELPQNSAAFEQLEGIVRSAAGEPLPVPALPPTALDISDITYRLDPNPLGLNELALVFQEGSDEAVLKLDDVPDALIGLDNRFRLTSVPGSRPIAMRGRWLGDAVFSLEFLVLGDFAKNAVLLGFDGDQMTLTIENLSFPGEPIVVNGARQT